GGPEEGVATVKSWDGLPAHKSKVMQEYLLQQRSWLTVERLPGYAPDLNPVERLLGEHQSARAGQPVRGGSQGSSQRDSPRYAPSPQIGGASVFVPGTRFFLTLLSLYYARFR